MVEPIPVESASKWPTLGANARDADVMAFLAEVWERIHPAAKSTEAERSFLSGQLLGLCMRLQNDLMARQTSVFDAGQKARELEVQLNAAREEYAAQRKVVEGELHLAKEALAQVRQKVEEEKVRRDRERAMK